ncbi:MAG: transporter, ATP-binding/permease protein [Candidatus Saccharibacteria bacterium]|nr:transporter, ATP-binding/permease protein [Candidatus Saccharibacteria bacterium]
MTNRAKHSYSLSRNVVSALKLYWQISKGLLMSYALLALIQVISSVVALYFGSRIIGQLASVSQGHTIVLKTLYGLVIASLGALFAERFAWRWLGLIERQAWVKWYVRMSVDFNAAVANLDMPQHHDVEFQKVLIKLNEQYTYTPQNFANYILQLFHSSARLISTLLIVLGFAPWLVPIMILSLLPGFITERWLSKLKWTLWGEKGDKNRLAWRIMHFLTYKDKLPETKIFGTKNFLLKRLGDLHNEFYDEQLRRMRKVQGRAFLSLLTEMVVLVGITIWLIRKVIQGSLNLAGFTFYSGIITQFSSSLGLIVNSFAFLNDQNEFMKDLFQLFDTKPVLPRPLHPVLLAPNTQLNIEFRNVTFNYPGNKASALKNISFSINPGDKIAFVGENGAGKTTIINLLLRFYDVTEGEILINGTNIKELDLPSYYHHVGVLFQYFNDYPFSVRDNIALGRVENFNNDEQVHKAAKLADATKFINAYPKKYLQILEVGFTDGIEPSGGQWQRIALARALFRDASMLILDEPTAAVDAKSEYAIFKTLEQHSKDKTTIIISHRFSTVRTAKIIFVIEDGTLKETGSHDALMKIKNGLYKEMFDKQAQGYR